MWLTSLVLYWISALTTFHFFKYEGVIGLHFWDFNVWPLKFFISEPFFQREWTLACTILILKWARYPSRSYLPPEPGHILKSLPNATWVWISTKGYSLNQLTLGYIAPFENFSSLKMKCDIIIFNFWDQFFLAPPTLTDTFTGKVNIDSERYGKRAKVSRASFELPWRPVTKSRKGDGNASLIFPKRWIVFGDADRE